MCQDDKSVFDLAVERRTIRKFLPKAVPGELLTRLVEAARLAPSAANVQPLEFIVVDEPETLAEVFPCLKWAAYIAPAGDPKAGEEPTAYVVTLVNTKVREKMYEYDVGAAMENMILTALGEGVGSCWLLSIDRDRLRAILSVPDGIPDRQRPGAGVSRRGARRRGHGRFLPVLERRRGPLACPQAPPCLRPALE